MAEVGAAEVGRHQSAVVKIDGAKMGAGKVGIAEVDSCIRMLRAPFVDSGRSLKHNLDVFRVHHADTVVQWATGVGRSSVRGRG